MDVTDTLQIRLKRHTDADIDYLIVEVLVGDTPLVDFEYFATDLHALLASTESSGEFFIITCWCGEPGCAGIRQGIQVRRESKLVSWHVPEPQPERQFVFERPEYDATILGAIQHCKHWLATNRFAPSSKRAIDVTPDSNSDFFDISRRHF